MDAATLYMVLTLPNGEQRTSTQKFATLEACEAQVLLRRARGARTEVKTPTGRQDFPDGPDLVTRERGLTATKLLANQSKWITKLC
jgi:hypothetical protein